ncbi:MAG: YegS/Rv2252/BmrU family lipid kinase [Eubacteriales bacterium]|nr:YegS/Rv2252/BmrU family lipid kinase [Eubacteriales bacterium]
MKHLFIVNPVAGGKDATGTVTAKVKKAFERREDTYEIYVTKCAMDAPVKIREEAAKGEMLRVYACGGDGTFNECVCGAAQLENVAVCPFPTGTGNDFCRMFGDDAPLFRDINAVIDGDVRKIDLIDCSGRWCANICSVGIDARIGTDVHKYSALPVIGGAAAYVVSAAVNMFKEIARNMKISCGDYHAEGQHSLVCACNGRFYGGGFNPTLSARPDDGCLDFIVVRKVNLLTFAALIGKYSKGKVREMKKYADVLTGDEITVEFDEETVINVDGEAVWAKSMHAEVVPGALNLIAPKGMKFFD